MHTRPNRAAPPTAAPALLVLALCAMTLCTGACSRAGAQAQTPRILVITPGEALAPREFRAAEALARGLPAAGRKAEILHAALPDKGAASAASVAAFIAGAASDGRLKALVVDPALPGTAEGFRRAREARPGLLLFARGGGEDALELEASADLVVDLDRLYRAYLVPWASKRMGARALAAVYKQDEAAEPLAQRERLIMGKACAELGLKYAEFESPAGSDAVAYTRAMTGSWLQTLGRDSSFYCADPSLVAPLLSGAIAGGALAADLAGEAGSAAYAAALGLDLSPAKGEARKERSLIEAALSGLGARGRFALWEGDFASASVEGLVEFALRVASGAARKDETKALVAAFDSASSDAAWLAAYDVDGDSGVASANHVLLRQDLYVLGSGYLQSALKVVPAKYLRLGADLPPTR